MIKKEYPSFNFNMKGNQYFCVLQIVRQIYHYQIRNMGPFFKPWKDVDKSDDVVFFAEIHAISALYTHVVCIYKGHIYDGTFRKCLKFSKEAIEWLANKETFHLKCFSLEPSKKLKRALTKTSEQKKRSIELPANATKRGKR